jgi:hypothetical protein
MCFFYLELVLTSGNGIDGGGGGGDFFQSGSKGSTEWPGTAELRR